MDWTLVWDVFTKFILPIVVGYAVYIHKELADVRKELKKLEREHLEHKAEVHATFVTHDIVNRMESRVLETLSRIDDKVTRILERDHK